MKSLCREKEACVSRVVCLWLLGVPVVAVGLAVAMFTGVNREASSEIVLTPPPDLMAQGPDESTEPLRGAEQAATGIRKIFSKAERMQIIHAAINVPR